MIEVDEHKLKEITLRLQRMWELASMCENEFIKDQASAIIRLMADVENVEEPI